MMIELSHYFLALSVCMMLNTRVHKITLSFLLLTCVFFGILLSYVSSDFSITNILSNSNVNAPFFYKISSTWSNHEGSLLLWCWILSAYGFGFCYLSRFSTQRLPLYQTILLFFVLFLLITSNPFLRLSFVSTHSLSELNPVLQDPVLAIHPPCIYAGYVASAIACSLCFPSSFVPSRPCFLPSSSFVEDNTSRKKPRFKERAVSILVPQIRIWILLCWCCLTLGILLGSWWAYHELGWGGWWFWDPVENASLMPWLVASAAIHSFLLPTHNLWTFVFVTLTFLLSILGTFFVRSGLIASVHSFATDPTRGTFLLVFFCILCVICLIRLSQFAGTKKSLASNFSFLSFLRKQREQVVGGIHRSIIGLQAFFFCIICCIVLCGTVAPVFFHWLASRDFSTGAPFYNGTIIPLVTALFLLLIYTHFFGKKKDNKQYKMSSGLRVNMYICILFLFFQCTLHTCGGITFWGFSYLESVYSNLCFLLFLGLVLSVEKNKSKIFTSTIAHGGIIFFILGILFSQRQKVSFTSLLRVGSEFSLGTEYGCLRSIDQSIGPTFQSICGNLIIGRVSLQSTDTNTLSMFPEKRFFAINNTSKIAVHSNLLTDFYSLIGSGSYDTGWYTTVLKFPFIFCIWIGFFLAFLAGVLSLKTQLANKSIYWL